MTIRVGIPPFADAAAGPRAKRKKPLFPERFTVAAPHVDWARPKRSPYRSGQAEANFID